MKKRMAPEFEDSVIPLSDLSDDELNELVKRGTILRFGKRGSLLRFGKRGTLLRFGKRRSLLRYGKRYDGSSNNVLDDRVALEDLLDNDSDNVYEKRGSLFRFGKRGSLLRYGRSADEKPHTPFRFGREEDE